MSSKNSSYSENCVNAGLELALFFGPFFAWTVQKPLPSFCGEIYISTNEPQHIAVFILDILYIVAYGQSYTKRRIGEDQVTKRRDIQLAGLVTATLAKWRENLRLTDIWPSAKLALPLCIWMRAISAAQVRLFQSTGGMRTGLPRVMPSASNCVNRQPLAQSISEGRSR